MVSRIVAVSICRLSVLDLITHSGCVKPVRSKRSRPFSPTSSAPGAIAKVRGWSSRPPGNTRTRIMSFSSTKIWAVSPWSLASVRWPAACAVRANRGGVASDITQNHAWEPRGCGRHSTFVKALSHRQSHTIFEPIWLGFQGPKTLKYRIRAVSATSY